jgi:acetyltransferase-like isoleucine patch superfamily enzyme
MNASISTSSKIGDQTLIGNNVTVYSNVTIGQDCIIGDNVTIGFPTFEDIKKYKASKTHYSHNDLMNIPCGKTTIGNSVIIYSNSVIYSNVFIGDDCQIFEHSRIGTGTKIGKCSKIRYGTQIYTDVSIGEKCVIAGFCCSRSKIGSNSTMMGNLVHKYNKGWIDGLNEPAPDIAENVVVGYNSTVVGNVKISQKVYIASGAIVTKDIPSDCIVINHCNIVENKNWDGNIDLNDLFNSCIEDKHG